MKRKKDATKRPFMSGVFGFAAFDTYYVARVKHLSDNAHVGTQR